MKPGLVSPSVHTFKHEYLRDQLADRNQISSEASLKRCDLSSAFIFQWIFFILAGNKVNHKSLDGFAFRQDSITDFGVSCP